MVDYIKYTPEMANNWSRAYIETHKERPWALQRLVDASTTSQLESKFWLTEELSNVNESPKSAVLLGGWFAHVITSLLLDYTSVEKVTNLEIDEDAHFISYKFNRRFKKKEPGGDGQYRSIRRNKRGGAMPVENQKCKDYGLICTKDQKCIGGPGPGGKWKYECVGSDRPEYHF